MTDIASDARLEPEGGGGKESAGEANAPVMEKVVEIIKTAPMKAGGKAWYNNSDIMTDYFDVAYYFDINIGKDYQNGYIVA